MLKLWDVASGRELAHLGKGDGQVIFLPDGKTLAAEISNSVTFWDLATRRPRHTVKCEGIDKLAISPDGKVLAIRTRPPDDEALNLYDAATGDPKKDRVW